MEVVGGGDAFSRVLVCEVGQQRYAFPFHDVIEVVQAVAVYPLPGAPAIVEGVINYRGLVVPCIALRARFEHAAEPLSITDNLIIARSGERVVALRVHGALDLAHVARGQMASAGALRGAAQGIAGVLALEEGLLLVLDLAALLDDAERLTLEHALRKAASGAEDAHG